MRTLSKLFVFAGLALATLTIAPEVRAALGDKAFAQAGTATCVVTSGIAGYQSLVYYDPPAGPDVLLGNNQVPNAPVGIAGFAAGDELVFKIVVTGEAGGPYTYFTGNGAGNPDGLPHANVTVVGNVVTVGFEDLLGGGDMDYDDAIVTVTFPEPQEEEPCVEATTNKSELWPPNHKMHCITVNYPDPVGGTCELTVTSNEPDNGLGDGDTVNDIQIINPHKVMLRAERSGLGTGRIYTIKVTCTLASGEVCVDTVGVTVPHDQGN